MVKFSRCTYKFGILWWWGGHDSPELGLCSQLPTRCLVRDIYQEQVTCRLSAWKRELAYMPVEGGYLRLKEWEVFRSGEETTSLGAAFPLPFPRL